nr:glycosyltransferase [Lutimaribacter sp. EGI FJ00013]
MLRRVCAQADRIICNSHVTAADVTRIADQWGALPPLVVAHLGVTAPRPAPEWPHPAGLDPRRPYFITVGTIEPRKNHAFLLDLWSALAQSGARPMPQLLICGGRGWQNANVFERLDRDAMMGRDVFEHPDLTDAQLGAAMTGAAGLLFPSLAEGFGLPPAEAAAMGVPVICNDLPVFREILGDIPVYADVNEIYHWQTTIMALVAEIRAGRKRQPAAMPSWETHFNTVLNKPV